MNTTQMIYADFIKPTRDKELILVTKRTKEDLAKYNIELTDGLTLTFYMDDTDTSGDSDPIVARGRVYYDAENERWLATIDWDKIYNLSDLYDEED